MENSEAFDSSGRELKISTTSKALPWKSSTKVKKLLKLAESLPEFASLDMTKIMTMNFSISTSFKFFFGERDFISITANDIITRVFIVSLFIIFLFYTTEKRGTFLTCHNGAALLFGVRLIGHHKTRLD